MNTQNTRRAFTLIELLVVLTIIGLLAALLFPVFARAREKARQSVCESNLHQIGLAIQMYQNDHDSAYPDHFFDARQMPAEEQPGYDLLLPYTHDPDIYHCTESRISVPHNQEPQLVLDYNYRIFNLISLEETSGLPDAMMKPEPLSVLVYDDNHREGNDCTYLFLRANGSVSQASQDKIILWVFDSGTWKPFGPWTVGQQYPVFPNEPWPPQFEK